MSIKQQQSAVLANIFTLDLKKPMAHNLNLSSLEENRISAGIEVYQRSLLANASRALAITFATVHSFIGESAFNLLVKSYLQSCGKAQYDWGELGIDFAKFINQQACDNSAILSAIAMLDFACHQAERATNIANDLSTLALLNEHDAYQLQINFSAGFTVLALTYPVDIIIAEIKSAFADNSELSLNDISQQLASFSEGKYYYLIWRPNFQAQYQQITVPEYQWLKLWQRNFEATDSQQLSIGKALDNHARNIKQTQDTSELSFSIIDWLPKAITQQLISSISVLNEC